MVAEVVAQGAGETDVRKLGKTADRDEEAYKGQEVEVSSEEAAEGDLNVLSAAQGDEVVDAAANGRNDAQDDENWYKG